MKTLVLGLGVSGIAAARFLTKQGEQVIGVDSSFPVLAEMQTSGIDCQHDSAPIDWTQIRRVVVSPGISPKHPLYSAATEKGIEVVGEAELALPHFKKPLVAVTGTNGKTTVALLAAHILNTAGIKAAALGNVGAALCDYLLDPGPEEAFVIELSSFQLETLRTPVFEGGVILNITPDHLDRYANMQEYAEAKCRLQTLMKREDIFFIQEQILELFASLLHGKNYQTFGMKKSCDLWTDKTKIVYRGNCKTAVPQEIDDFDASFQGQQAGPCRADGGLLEQAGEKARLKMGSKGRFIGAHELCNSLYREKVECILPNRYREMGRHDYENALAAWALLRPFSIPNELFCIALETFRKPPHRIEFVREVDGISFYDDSKGTNIDAVIQAVQAMKGPVILIVGGIDKGASYLPWKLPFSGKVKQMVAIGAAARKIYEEMHPYFNITLADSLASAVHTALGNAEKGDCILLSPGCSSFDMFRDYAHRGEEFQREVNSIRR